MCIYILICAHTHTVVWRDTSQARVRFKMNFLDLASSYQAAHQISRCIKTHNEKLADTLPSDIPYPT